MSSNGAHLEGFAVELSQWRKFARHPLSEIFPDMEDVSFEAMTADMKERGYDNKQQVLLFEGKVLDGWHRIRAAVISGRTPTFDNYKGNDPVGEVIRRNLTRRHLDASQRAMVAARLSSYLHGGDRKNQAANLPLDRTQAGAAKTLNVSERSVRDAAKVVSEGSPKLQEAVVNGAVSVSDAAKVVNEPPKVQNQAVNAVINGTAPTVAAAVNGKKGGKGTPRGPNKPKTPEQKSKDAHGNIGKVVRYADELVKGRSKHTKVRDEILEHLQQSKNLLSEIENALGIK